MRHTDQLGGVFVHAQPVQRLVDIGADQALRKHQVGQVGFTNFGKDLVGGHVGSGETVCVEGVERTVDARNGRSHQASSVA
jgi:hypothetical protein